ncbi:hypothetical protein DSO57_1034082 [Entomophthora muscae]|uniref:Uncharacterized protein n=1 Tax=Entomophthora muscae TaxID=34485 RepID=A0ACC2REM2_9FUNG|nr:hypothetical protein DSO57_1034082 [Entomophthora muscae]
MVLIQHLKLHKKKENPIYKFHNLANRVAHKKNKKSMKKDYQEGIQKVVKKNYKVVEIKKHLENVAQHFREPTLGGQPVVFWECTGCRFDGQSPHKIGANLMR